MPKQDISVKDLVSKVVSGEITLPEMQRKYVWRDVKVRDLFDSLYRGYPSGTILVWQTDEVIDDTLLQISETYKSSLSSKLLLLDGQQRLTSLSTILSGKPVKVRNKKKPINILFNLEHPENLFEEVVQADIEEEFEREAEEVDDDDIDNDIDEDEIMDEIRKRTFIVANPRLKNDPYWISVTDIFKKPESELLKPLKINSDHPNWNKYSQRIQRVKKIEDYQYVMQILDKSLSYEEVTEIFVRVNSLGVKLRGSDLALAQITSRWRGFMKELEKFAGQFGKNGEYLQDSGILIKMMIAFATNQSKYKTVNRISLSKLKDSWEKTKRGITYALNFLESNIGVANLNLLSSPFLLIPISYYAELRKENFNEEELKNLQLWFYVAHMKGRYSRGSSESYLDVDLSILNNTKDLNELLEVLKIHVRDYYITEEELKNKNRRSPYFSTLYLIFKKNKVKDWNSGLALSEKHKGRSHSLQYHHIFPKSLLRNIGFDRRSINDIANLAFINGKTNRKISNKEPKIYLNDIINKYDRKTLESQLIPMDNSFWELSEYVKFTDLRRKSFVACINEFINELT